MFPEEWKVLLDHGQTQCQGVGELRSALESLCLLTEALMKGGLGTHAFSCLYLLMVIKLLLASQRAKPENVMIKHMPVFHPEP